MQIFKAVDEIEGNVIAENQKEGEIDKIINNNKILILYEIRFFIFIIFFFGKDHLLYL